MNGQRATEPPTKDALPFLPLIAATPVVFAVLTLPYLSMVFPASDFLRFFSAPVTIIEMITVLLAVLRGVDIFAPLRGERLWVKLALLIVCAVAIGTMIAATHDPLSAYLRTFAWGVHLLFGLSVAGVTRTFWAGREGEVWPWLLAGLLAYLGMLIAFVASLGGTKDYDWMWFGLGVINVRQLGFYSAAGFAIAIGLAILAATRRERWIWVGAAAAMIALSFWSGTRSSALSSIAALGVAALMYSEVRTWRALSLSLFSFIVGALLSVIYVAPEAKMGLKRLFSSVSAGTGDAIASGRIEIWIATAKAIPKRPLFGYGESQFREMEPTALGTLNHPHNMFLQFLYQWGLIGGGGFLVLAGLLFWRLAGAAKANPKIALPALLIVTNMFAMAQIEGSMYHPFPIMIAVFALGFGLSANGTMIAPSAETV